MFLNFETPTSFFCIVRARAAFFEDANDFIYGLVTGDDPLEVKYFKLTKKGRLFTLGDKIWKEKPENFLMKVALPVKVPQGSRTYYSFS